MKRLLVTLIASALVFPALGALAADQASQSRIQTVGPEGNTTQVTAEERAKMKAEKAEKAAAKKEAASKQKQKARLSNEPAVAEGNTTQVSAEERAKLKAEKTASKETKASMTREEKKAAAKQKQKDLATSTKGEHAQ